MNTFMLVLIIGCGTLSVISALKGVRDTQEGLVGKIAHLSIPVFFFTTMWAFTTVKSLSWIAIMAVIFTATICIISNNIHNRRVMAKVKKRLQQ